MNSLHLMYAYPEMLLSGAISVLLILDLFLSDAKRNWILGLSLSVLLLCAALNLAYLKEGLTAYLFNGMYVSDAMGNLLKAFCCVSVGIVLLYARRYATERSMINQNATLPDGAIPSAGAISAPAVITAKRNVLGGEFYPLALFALLGQMVMISAHHVLVLYLGLELMSLALYTLVALRRDHAQATEAAMKYFVLGALSSGFLLYGISMLYGATGALDLGEITRVVAAGAVNKSILVFAVVFIVSGLAFKLGVAPFHMWIPDVYHGAPTATTLLIASAPKLAAFAICMRLLVETLLPLAVDWQQMLTVLAVLSIALGNLAAIAQTNLKRMLGYSAIAQMGFMLLGLLSGVIDGNVFSAANAYSSSLFYMITYVLTTLATFGIILFLAHAGFEAERLEDLRGLNRRSPWFAFVMLVMMFSLAGLPPTMGFYAKLSVLQAVLGTGQISLAVFAVLFSLIGAFYYLRIVKLMYFDEPEHTQPLPVDRPLRWVLSLNAIVILGLGFWPDTLMNACTNAIVKTLAS